MDAFAFLQRHGWPVCAAVAKAAGTNREYFSQIAHGHRRPSIDMAERLVAASAQLVEAHDERLDLLSLLRPGAASTAGNEKSAA